MSEISYLEFDYVIVISLIMGSVLVVFMISFCHDPRFQMGCTLVDMIMPSLNDIQVTVYQQQQEK